ncbi:MAG: AraC family transcriptional regulator [Lautropia sp.]|nr:AraC family transcriptional regulator [Lautropia sp.]
MLSNPRLLERIPRNQAWQTPVPGLSTFHTENTTEELTPCVQEPSLCLILQGEKEVRLGERLYRYDAEHFICYSMTLPISVRISSASSDSPYIGLILTLEPQHIARILPAIPDVPDAPPRDPQPGGLVVTRLTPELRSAVERLLALIHTPVDIPILAPLIKHEIHYRLLCGSQGRHLRQLFSHGSHSHRIGKATHWLQRHYAEPLRVDTLALQIGMSVSSFHQRFREETLMTPLQYQKRLRLTEARRLIRGQRLPVAGVARMVGYDSASQFSREYKRFFGTSPSQDSAGGHIEPGEQTQNLG